MDASNKNYSADVHLNDDLDWIKWYVQDSEKNFSKLKKINDIFWRNKFTFLNPDKLYDHQSVWGTVYQWEKFDGFKPENSEIYIDREKTTCTIVIGSDICYNSQTIQDDLEVRLSNSLAKIIAESMDSDLYLSAMPGQHNYSSIYALHYILNYLQKLKTYEKIYILFELSSPHLCYNEYPRTDQNMDHALWFLGGHEGEADPEWGYSFKLDLKEYFNLYQWAYIDHLEKIQNSFKNIQIGVWKYDHHIFDNKLIFPKSFIEYFTGTIAPYVRSEWWYKEHYEKIYMLNSNHTDKKEQLDKIKHLMYVNWEPSQINEWASILLKHFGWSKTK